MSGETARKRLLVGMGFDSKDGHVRITKGTNFRLYGGSDQTHGIMQEKAVKFNEYLDKKGKNLDEIEIEEFYDIADKIGLKVPKGRVNKTKKKKGGK